MEGMPELVLVSTFTKIFLQGNSITYSRDQITCQSSITVYWHCGKKVIFYWIHLHAVKKFQKHLSAGNSFIASVTVVVLKRYIKYFVVRALLPACFFKPVSITNKHSAAVVHNVVQ